MHLSVIGIVVSSRNFSDSDRFYTVFSKELGLVDCIAKGIRKITSSRSPHLDILNEVKLSLNKRKDYYYITDSKSVNQFSNIKANLYSSSWAFYILEAITGLIAKEDVNEELYYKTLNTIKNLNCTPSKRDIYKYLRYLINSQGYWSVKEAEKFDFLKSIDSPETVSKENQALIDIYFTSKIQGITETSLKSNLLIHQVS